MNSSLGREKNIRAYHRVLARVLLWSALCYNNVFPIAASVCECVRAKSWDCYLNRSSFSSAPTLSARSSSSSPASEGHRGSMPRVHAPGCTHTYMWDMAATCIRKTRPFKTRWLLEKSGWGAQVMESPGSAFCYQVRVFNMEPGWMCVCVCVQASGEPVWPRSTLCSAPPW